MAKPRENHRGTRPAPDGAEARQSNRWRATFLNHLAESSNVSESAAKAGIGIGRAYKVRREEPEFARQWLMALWEGYSHLEMEVVRRLRECSLTIAGTSHILRPSFENLVLAEAELGSLFALVERASQGMLTLAEMAALLWHCLPADNRPDRSLVGHAIATGIVLIDDSLVALDAAEVPALATTRIAAIGTGDPEAVIANLANAGLSRRPPAPVHARVQVTSSGEWQICWTRRARGQWRWDDGVEVALVEEREAYLVGFGPISAPFAAWSAQEPRLNMTQEQRTGLLSAWGPADLWVRQVGTFGQPASGSGSVRVGKPRPF